MNTKPTKKSKNQININLNFFLEEEIAEWFCHQCLIRSTLVWCMWDGWYLDNNFCFMNVRWVNEECVLLEYKDQVGYCLEVWFVRFFILGVFWWKKLVNGWYFKKSWGMKVIKWLNFSLRKSNATKLWEEYWYLTCLIPLTSLHY